MTPSQTCALLPLLLFLAVPLQTFAQHARAVPAKETAANAKAHTTAGSGEELRRGLAVLEAQLDRVVDGTGARPIAHFLGRQGARGYRLPGYGVVVVLSPRVLPRMLPHVRHEIRLSRPAAARRGEPEVESIEKQIVVLQRATEESRRAAEEDLARIVVTARRLAGREESGDAEPAPAPVAEPAEGPEPPASPAPPPPWTFWFGDAVPGDPRPPEAIIAQARNELVDALARGPARVPGLAPDESVTVVLDFESPGWPGDGERRRTTIVVRARARDIEARAQGALAPDELRRRLELVEY